MRRPSGPCASRPRRAQIARSSGQSPFRPVQMPSRSVHGGLTADAAGPSMCVSRGQGLCRRPQGRCASGSRSVRDALKVGARWGQDSARRAQGRCEMTSRQRPLPASTTSIYLVHNHLRCFQNEISDRSAGLACRALTEAHPGARVCNPPPLSSEPCAHAFPCRAGPAWPLSRLQRTAKRKP